MARRLDLSPECANLREGNGDDIHLGGIRNTGTMDDGEDEAGRGII
jgi:hypothetical protein